MAEKKQEGPYRTLAAKFLEVASVLDYVERVAGCFVLHRDKWLELAHAWNGRNNPERDTDKRAKDNLHKFVKHYAVRKIKKRNMIVLNHRVFHAEIPDDNLEYLALLRALVYASEKPPDANLDEVRDAWAHLAVLARSAPGEDVGDDVLAEQILSRAVLKNAVPLRSIPSGSSSPKYRKRRAVDDPGASRSKRPRKEGTHAELATPFDDAASRVLVVNPPATPIDGHAATTATLATAANTGSTASGHPSTAFIHVHQTFGPSPAYICPRGLLAPDEAHRPINTTLHRGHVSGGLSQLASYHHADDSPVSDVVLGEAIYVPPAAHPDDVAICTTPEMDDDVEAQDTIEAPYPDHSSREVYYSDRSGVNGSEPDDFSCDVVCDFHR